MTSATSIQNTLQEMLGLRTLAVAVTLVVTIALVPAAFGQCTLNGVANACLLIGPVTITTTYDAPNNTTTTASGTITNNGAANFTSGANNLSLIHISEPTRPY